MKQPNFLFIIFDQLRADHVGFGGNDIEQTPNLDKLASEGVVFDRAYVPNPICGPCRRSILTGRMPSMHGGWDNHTALDWDANTFVRVLREDGYQTALIGKSHIQEMFDKPPDMDGPPPPGGAAPPKMFPPSGGEGPTKPNWPEGWDLWERGGRYLEEWVDVPEDFYGFDHVDLVVGHEDRPSGHYFHWLKEQGVDVEQLGRPGNALESYEGWSQQVYKSNVPEELFHTSYITKRTVEYLEKAKEEDRPFCVWASYPDPHHPFAAPGEYWDMYDPDSIPIPDTFHNPHEDTMPHFKRLIEGRGVDWRGPFPFGITEEQVRHATAVEYGTITLLDKGVGQILAALERLELDESTVVVFVSDHADMFGDHGIMLKHAIHYQGVIRVPLVIRALGVDPARCESMVSLLDLPHTVLDLASQLEFGGMQGVSLRPLLENPSGKVRDAVLIEEEMPVDVMGLNRPYALRTLLTDKARLTIYGGIENAELYDLENDPDELNNLFDKPEGQQLRAEMMERLARTMLEYSDQGTSPQV
jgi:arylsulfatase A-like enzyme